MTTIYLRKSDPMVADLAQAAFPGYNGRKFQARFNARTVDLTSAWGGGSRSSFAIVRLSDLKVMRPQQGHPMFVNLPAGLEAFEIPEGFVVVEHIIFQGRDLGLRFHAPNANLLPAPEQPQLSKVQQLVLGWMTTLTSAGRKDARLRYRMPDDVWNPVLIELAAMGLVKINKAGAARATLDGKNWLASTGPEPRLAWEWRERADWAKAAIAKYTN